MNLEPAGPVVLRDPQSVHLIGGFCAVIVEQLFGTAVLPASPVIHMPIRRARRISENETNVKLLQCHKIN